MLSATSFALAVVVGMGSGADLHYGGAQHPGYYSKGTLATHAADPNSIELAAAAAYLGVSEPELTAPALSRFPASLPSSMWRRCSHTTCRLEKRRCTPYVTTGTEPWVSGEACSHALTMRTYHHGRENMGSAHRCRVVRGECTCSCAHETLLDRLGDEFSGYSLRARTECTTPDTWDPSVAPRWRCLGNAIPHPRANTTTLEKIYVAARYGGASTAAAARALSTLPSDSSRPQYCKYLCEDLGATCLRFDRLTGDCQCFDGKARKGSPCSGGIGFGCPAQVDAPCTVTPAFNKVDMAAGILWYRRAAALGSRWAHNRLKFLQRVPGRVPKGFEAIPPPGYSAVDTHQLPAPIPAPKVECGDEAHFCTNGVKMAVSAGYYSTGGTPTTRTGQAECGGAMYWCAYGIRHRVSSGYRTVGSSPRHKTGQQPCGDPRHYCHDGTRQLVPPGFFGIGGNHDTRNDFEPCGENRSPAATVYCVNGARSTVPWGFYSTGGNGPDTRTGMLPCPKGARCMNGERMYS